LLKFRSIFVQTRNTITHLPFVKRFALFYWIVVCRRPICLSCTVLYVCEVGVLWPTKYSEWCIHRIWPFTCYIWH